MKPSNKRPAKNKFGFGANVNSRSLTGTILAHLILLVLAFLFTFKYVKPAESPPGSSSFLQGGGGGGGSADNSMQYQMQNKKATPSTSITNPQRIFAAGAVAHFTIPEIGKDIVQMPKLASANQSGLSGGLGGSGGGSGGGIGGGIGGGLGKGSGNGLGLGFSSTTIPLQMGKRCLKEDRLQRLKEMGGTPKCEDAVVKGLQWLKANQNKDGSWGNSYEVAMTGFALLSYFGHCETPKSIEFGDSCMKGIAYLINCGLKNQDPPDLLHGLSDNSYENAIGTYALAEAVVLCKEVNLDLPSLLEVTRNASTLITNKQNSIGAWGYSYDEGGDVSISGWQMQALKACSNAGIKSDRLPEVIARSLDFINGRQGELGGYGYSGVPTGPGYQTLTGVGMLCNQIWGRGYSHEVSIAAKHIYDYSNFSYSDPDYSLYSHYYEAQAMMQLGGHYWEWYNKNSRDILLRKQNFDGSWIQTKGTLCDDNSITSKVYRSSLCILMLEVYYRYLSENEVYGKDGTIQGGDSKPDI